MPIGMWIVSGFFFINFVWVAICNLWTIIRFYLYGKKGSRIPFIGGILGLFGIFLAPGGVLLKYWWIPLVLDVGCLPLLVQTIWFLIRRKFIRKD
jgi:hypothetical protein